MDMSARGSISEAVPYSVAGNAMFSGRACIGKLLDLYDVETIVEYTVDGREKDTGASGLKSDGAKNWSMGND